MGNGSKTMTDIWVHFQTSDGEIIATETNHDARFLQNFDGCDVISSQFKPDHKTQKVDLMTLKIINKPIMIETDKLSKYG